MSSQIAANSIEGLKDLRAAMAVYGEDTLGALGAVFTEIRRTNRWLQQEGPAFWQDQIKRRREQVASAQAEVFRRKLAKNAPSMSEQVENLRRAEARLQDAEKRLALTRKWQPQFQHAVLEYQGAVRRLKTMAAGEVPAGVNLLGRLIDALESYLQVSPPSAASLPDATTAPPEMEAIAVRMIEAEPPPSEPEAEDEDEDEDEPADDDCAGGLEALA